MSNTQNESWVVTNVTDDFMTVPGQGTVPAKRVSYRTYLGQTSSVLIPDSLFNADYVAEQIDAMAQTVMGVSILKGAPVVPNMPTYNPETGLYDLPETS